jgi:fatty acid desaturase
MLSTPSAPDQSVPPNAGERRPAPSSRFRSLWLCLAVGLLAIAVLAWLFGLTWWTVLVAAVLIACPVVMAWILLGGFDNGDWPRAGQ